MSRNHYYTPKLGDRVIFKVHGQDNYGRIVVCNEISCTILLEDQASDFGWKLEDYYVEVGTGLAWNVNTNMVMPTTTELGNSFN